MKAEEILKGYKGEKIGDIQVFGWFRDVPRVIIVIFESGRELKITSTIINNHSPDSVECIPTFSLNT